ncbi:MAG: hypothetical protein JRI25_04220 [Deltaproteobacteria bacterium]|nr:hypothetical protein [Deltaproteobacteria bacterium]MBW2253785.1 hypothetical protein [Deltaproteobacteria bacterium]
MSQTAAHLVFPEVPVRRGVLTLPMPLRFWLARRPRLCREVLAVLLRAVFGWYRKRARAAGVAGGRCGAVTFVQSFGSAAHAASASGRVAMGQRAGRRVRCLRGVGQPLDPLRRPREPHRRGLAGASGVCGQVGFERALCSVTVLERV